MFIHFYRLFELNTVFIPSYVFGYLPIWKRSVKSNSHVRGERDTNAELNVTRVEPDTRLKRVSCTDKALLPSTSIIRVIRVNICARIE